jgi:hypothetical protein
MKRTIERSEKYISPISFMLIHKQKIEKIENRILSVLLYGVLLVYLYQFMLVAGKYKTFTTDEKFYYIEAKAISANNIYQTPASLDGNTSFIGGFGFHGLSYALKDGWLAKLFFCSDDPPLLWNNVLTCLLTLAIVFLFKSFSLNTRIKIALLIATHYVLFYYTLSYMQETIHYLFAVIALWNLYLLYTNQNGDNRKYLYSYLLLVIIAITFRYGWFIWGLGLLPLAKNYISFFKWCGLAIALALFGIFVNRYIASPYPYGHVADKITDMENFSLLRAVEIAVDNFCNTIHMFIVPGKKIDTTVMRYLFLVLLFINTWYAIIKRNRFIIACALVAWGYFLATMTFYVAFWGYDERSMAVLNPLLAFSLVGTSNKWIFYPVVLVQLLLFPGIVKETEERNLVSINANAPNPVYLAVQNAHSKISNLITDDTAVVVQININLVKHGSLDYFNEFPLVNIKGHPIHYRVYRNGNDLRKIHFPTYFLNPPPERLPPNCRLIYSDSWMNLYRTF